MGGEVPDEDRNIRNVNLHDHNSLVQKGRSWCLPFLFFSLLGFGGEMSNPNKLQKLDELNEL
jgi:hypothetical protein